MTITLQQIQERAYATAKAKGWHERPLRETLRPGGVSLAFEVGNVHVGEPKRIDHDRVLATHALMHTELTEAHECLEIGDLALRIDAETSKPEGFAVEAADCVIRICDTTRALGIELRLNSPWPTVAEVQQLAGVLRIAAGHKDEAERYLGRIRRYIDQATEAARVDDWTSYGNYLTLAVLDIAYTCAGLGLDLMAAIETKMAYNETRPHRHGGKQA